MTPGHPEFPNSEHNTPGIEATTGPLGQGVVNAAGIAAAQKMEQAMFNTKDHTIFDSVTISLCGDGCLQVRAASAVPARHAEGRAVGCLRPLTARDAWGVRRACRLRARRSRRTRASTTSSSFTTPTT
jgi:hypothetical protein